MTVEVPALTSDAGVSQQTEAQLLTETEPAATFLSAAVETNAGTLTISQQLYDRSGGPNSVGYDSVAAKQLAIDLAKAQDQQALTASISGGAYVIYNAASFALAGTSGVGGFVDKLAAAKYAIRGTAGGYLEPTSVFFTPERFEFIAGWADAQGRPIVLPAATDDSPRQYGDTGLVWGGLHVYTDPNIPSYGTTSEDQVIVADESEVFFWRSPVPMVQVFPQTNAIQLECVIRLYSYSAVIARHANAVQVISGTGLAPITF
jgi:HK97 family phage major capsid protein